MAHYGKFSGVTDYIAMIGKKGPTWMRPAATGERLVLLAQQLGLNTCWVAMTYSKIRTAFEVRSGEKLCIVIAIGYGLTQGLHTNQAFGMWHRLKAMFPTGLRKELKRLCWHHSHESAKIHVYPEGQPGVGQSGHGLFTQRSTWAL